MPLIHRPFKQPLKNEKWNEPTLCSPPSAKTHQLDVVSFFVTIHRSFNSLHPSLAPSIFPCISLAPARFTIFELELRKCTSRTRLALQSFDFRAGAAEVYFVLQSFDFRSGAVQVYFAYLSCTTKLRISSWSCGSVLRVLNDVSSYPRVQDE